MTKKSDGSFQKDFEDLEKIVQKFEAGEMDLDESLEEFEKGLALAAACKKRLSAIQLRVVEIKKKFASLAHTEESPAVSSDEIPF